MFIDRASHACNTELVGLETIDLDKTIGIALDFAEKDGNTLVIVVGGQRLQEWFSPMVTCKSMKS